MENDRSLNTADLQPYLDDIRDIKNLLAQNSEKPIIEAWAYFTWAGLILLGTIGHLLLVLQQSPAAARALWIIWLPLITAAIILESIGFIRMARKRGPVLVNPKRLHDYLSMSGIGLSFGAILVYLLATGTLQAGILLCLLSSCFLFIAHISFSRILIPAFLLLGLGLVMLATSWTGTAAYAAGGFASAAAFLLGGIFSRSGQQRHE
ncbi:MAG: hypothetical protein KKC64_09150 [Spirochaetes bacterium]|nr:hypothetical protein [Spirochaetota bacterium]